MTKPEMTIPEYGQAKYIVLSDCHRGDGGAGDEFARNSLIYKCALEYYLAEGFTYIELGDAEELWENDAFEQIYITHTSVYDLLRRFHDPDPARTRYLKVWGNHDEVWREDPAPLRSLFPGIEVHEGVCLSFSGATVLLLHGHQADPKCRGIGARFSKLVVRHIWSFLQRLGFHDPTRAAENPGRCDEIDEALYRFARGRDTDASLACWREPTAAQTHFRSHLNDAAAAQGQQSDAAPPPSHGRAHPPDAAGAGAHPTAGGRTSSRRPSSDADPTGTQSIAGPQPRGHQADAAGTGGRTQPITGPQMGSQPAGGRQSSGSGASSAGIDVSGAAPPPSHGRAHPPDAARASAHPSAGGRTSSRRPSSDAAGAGGRHPLSDAAHPRSGPSGPSGPLDAVPLIVVAGHTHRPVYANLSLTERRFLETGIGTRGVRRKDRADPVYFNTGSCVHPRCITGIEITSGSPPDAASPRFTLVKWGNVAGASVDTVGGSRGYPLAVTRTVLES
ncbi:MAG: hypothetical protein QM278_03020 [Pseudomonadota bacterium]|nr:hypothetical protein [Pseudomonadota bacterium]